MRISFSRLLFFLFFATLTLSGCEKIELPDKNKTEGKTDKGDTKDDDDDDDDEETSDTLTIAQALKASDEDEYIIKGYIVGYASGSSLSSAVFGIPPKANTNMLLADSPYETEAARCLPVKLSAAGAISYRDELNLFDHPEYLGARIAIDGWMSQYFKVNGIIGIYDYDWVSASSGEDPDDPTDPEDPDAPDDPGDSGEVVTPGISDDSDIIDGR